MAPAYTPFAAATFIGPRSCSRRPGSSRTRSRWRREPPRGSVSPVRMRVERGGGAALVESDPSRVRRCAPVPPYWARTMLSIFSLIFASSAALPETMKSSSTKTASPTRARRAFTLAAVECFTEAGSAASCIPAPKCCWASAARSDFPAPGCAER